MPTSMLDVTARHRVARERTRRFRRRLVVAACLYAAATAGFTWMLLP